MTYFPAPLDRAASDELLGRARTHVDDHGWGFWALEERSTGAFIGLLAPGETAIMVGGLVAANSSTILTHLNWGASYLVHDFIGDEWDSDHKRVSAAVEVD